MAASPTTATASGWQQTARKIAIGSGKANRFVSSFSKAGRVLGPLGVTYRIYPGYAAGSAATAFLVGLAFSNPIDWVAMGLTLIGGAICAYLFSEGGRCERDQGALAMPGSLDLD